MKKHYSVLVVLAAFFATAIGALSGCVVSVPSPGVALVAQRSEPLVEGFATLADSSNPAEMAAASVYTRLALYRRRAAGYLRYGLITIAQAEQAQITADSIRRQLDAAVSGRNLPAISWLSSQVDIAINSLGSKK